MSEKIITFEKFRIICDKFEIEPCAGYGPRYMCSLAQCPCNPECCEKWEDLPKPTLSDVCGTRTLDSMTEEEFIELMKIANLELDRIDKNPDDNSDSIFKNYSIIKAPGNELEGIYWEDGIDEMHERELGIEPGLVFIGCFTIHPRETFKWFIDHGFNMFGDVK